MLSNHLLAIAFLSSASLTLGAAPDQTALTFTSHHEFPIDPELKSPTRYPQEYISDITPDSSDTTPTLTLKARPTTVYRPRSRAALQQSRLRSLHFGESEKVEWDHTEVLGPDIEDRHTLSQLARMTGNAYALPGQKNWYDVDPAWNTVRPQTLKVNLMSISDVAEFSIWMGRCHRRIPRARFHVLRQLHRHPLYQRHNPPGPNLQERQIQRQSVRGSVSYRCSCIE